MKKLLIYLLLIACFESFISATPSIFRQKKVSSLTNINVSDKGEMLPQNSVDTEIDPLNIFSFHLH